MAKVKEKKIREKFNWKKELKLASQQRRIFSKEKRWIT